MYMYQCEVYTKPTPVNPPHQKPISIQPKKRLVNLKGLYSAHEKVKTLYHFK